MCACLYVYLNMYMYKYKPDIALPAVAEILNSVDQLWEISGL